MINAEIERRFWQYVRSGSADDCWEWQGCVVHHGYGHFAINRKIHLAHRVAYQLVKGDIPKGLLVMHTCDNRKCVNPDHLQVGTYYDNNHDAHLKGRAAPHLRKLNPEDIFKIAELKTDGKTNGQIAQLFGVTRAAIWCIVNGKSWQSEWNEDQLIGKGSGSK